MLHRHFPIIFILTCGLGAAGQSKSRDTSCQSYPIDTILHKIAWKDSVHVGTHYRWTSLQEMIDNWNDWISNGNHAQKDFNYNASRYVRCCSIHEDAQTPDGRPLKQRAVLEYHSVGADGKVDHKDKTNGNVYFDLVYWVRGQYAYIEFTDLSFIGPVAEMGNFEDPQLLSNDGVHYCTEQQMPWTRIKADYFERIKLVSRDLVRFIQYYYKTPLAPIRYRNDKQPW
jgi:hypothetical protein